ncbi:hypothetical protein AXK12_02310 [Cephaloticoccus capnophilus]|uniref:Uncharacterized protein n=1 Tax=Cephaloticoccus capnophilus TaxID=1548208 RepID=A0A139SRF8_9BACT|nr:hypothetical protein [Cephaloticoccus capnophilus]KXU37094.1 hypothetical protein AXK12_02310 [Cephaloticoccus capnophilus]
MTDAEIQPLIDEASYDYAMGEAASALTKLRDAAQSAPHSFDLWHTLAEIALGAGLTDEALAAAEKAHALRGDDLLINTTLSRIWVERGDKARAERYAAQAKILGWKEQLKGGASTAAPTED